MGEITVEEFRTRLKQGDKEGGSSSNVRNASPGSVANITQDPCTLREGEILSPSDLGVHHPASALARSEQARDVSSFDLTPPILRGVELGKVTSRADFIRSLTQNLPLNEYGLPTYVYRGDLIDVRRIRQRPTTTTTGEGSGAAVKSSQAGQVGQDWDYDAITAMLEAAVVYFVYDLGYPTFPSGNPFWEQLPWESTDAFMAFVAYLELEGVRSLTAEHEELRSYPLENLVEWHKLYYWSLRGRAYDIYRAAHHDRLRMQRIIRMENDHYKQGEKLFNRLASALANKSEDEIQGVDPDKLLKMMETAARLQRVATGLPAQGGLADDKRHIPSVEIALKRSSDPDSRQQKVEEFSTSELFHDPDVLESAQDLIISIGGRK